jgi:2-ketoarginine methyltransferase
MGQIESKLFEKQLIKGLQPIREFVLAQALYHFLDMGIQKIINDSPNILIINLAKKLHLDPGRLKGFLQYLHNEGYIMIDENESVSLSDSGNDIAIMWPWYKLLVGGYSQTFQQIGITLKENSKFATRDSTSVGIGSCGISQYDALPMTRKLISHINDNIGTDPTPK